MKITFFARTIRKNLELVEFYRQDLVFLREICQDLVVATRWREIDWRSDVIFIWWWTYAFLPVLIGKILNKKTIITGTFNFRCPGYEKDYFNRPWHERFLIRFSAYIADWNVLVSMREGEALRRAWRLDNISYSPHTVDIETYHPGGLREGNLVFTLSGMTPDVLRRKCIREIIEAMKILDQRSTGIRLVIGGRGGDGVDSVKRLIQDNELAGVVHFVGELSLMEKVKYFQRCAIYLQPSKFEGFGLAIAEAMSCGAPVVTSDVGAVREVVGDAGILLDSCEPDRIAEAISRLLADDSERELLGRRAREKIVRDFPPARRREELGRLISGPA